MSPLEDHKNHLTTEEWNEEKIKSFQSPPISPRKFKFSETRRHFSTCFYIKSFREPQTSLIFPEV